jgi:hypothetical protein
VDRRVLLLTFLAAGWAAIGAQAQTRTVTCSSDDGRRHSCSVEVRGDVRLLRQFSGSPCRQDETWGYDSNRIWVDQGCRAEFEILGYSQSAYSGSGNVIRCSSDDGGRRVCSVDTAGGVRLLRQLSGSRCDQGSTWGYDRNGIWVDRGCRAEFEVLPYSQSAYGRSVSVITCSSDDGGRRVCPADIRGTVRMVRQISGSRCEQGYSWGYDTAGVWVDHGCRAEFEIRSGRRYGGSQQQTQTQATVIRCSSDDGGRQFCSANTSGGVRLVRQISGSRCQQGSTWGYDQSGIWVDRGCRAEFEVGGAQTWPAWRR